MDPFEIIIVPIGILSTVDCTLHMSAAKENVWVFSGEMLCLPAKVAQKLRFLERVLLHSTIDITFMIVPTRLLSRKIFCLGHKRQYYKPSSAQEFFHAVILKEPQVAKLGRI